MWVYCDMNENDVTVGDTVFLATRLEHGRERTIVSKRPFRTNQSRERVYRGWCGETNNVAKTAIGCASVSRIVLGDYTTARLYVKVLSRGKRDAALRALGLGVGTERNGRLPLVAVEVAS